VGGSVLGWLVKCCGEEQGRRRMGWRAGGEAVVRLQRSGGGVKIGGQSREAKKGRKVVAERGVQRGENLRLSG